MFYRSYTPGPSLGDFIGRCWLCSDMPAHSRERILPSGTIELVFNLCDDEIRIYDPAHHDRYTRYSGAVVSGAYNSFFVIDPLVHASIVGVHFRPGGASPFLMDGYHWPGPGPGVADSRIARAVTLADCVLERPE